MCCAQWLSHVRFSATPWTAVCQAPLSMGFPRQEYWNGLPFPFLGDLPHPRIEPASPSLLVDSLPLSHQTVYTCYHYTLLYGQRIFKDNLTPSKKSYMLIQQPQTSLKFNTTGLLKSPAVVTKVFLAQTLSHTQASVTSVVTTCHY